MTLFPKRDLSKSHVIESVMEKSVQLKSVCPSKMVYSILEK